MALDGIRVNHSSLDDASSAMLKGVKDINDRLNRLEDELKPLRNDWMGNQQNAYHEAKRKWDTAINEMTQLLNETHLAVTSSREDYQAADANGAKRFM